jgi:hypothetical protein
VAPAPGQEQTDLSGRYGTPAGPREIRELVLRLARQNPRWDTGASRVVFLPTLDGQLPAHSSRLTANPEGGRGDTLGVGAGPASDRIRSPAIVPADISTPMPDPHLLWA